MAESWGEMLNKSMSLSNYLESRNNSSIIVVSTEYYFNTYVLWGFMILYLVMFLLGLLNVITLFMIVGFRRMRTVTNVYIFNLSLADLIYILFLPCVVLFQVTQNWTLGPVVCKLFHIADSTAKYVSIYFVTILTIDRYLALCHSSWCKVHRTQHMAKYVSIFGWLLIMVPMMPAYMYSGVIDIGSNLSICSFQWPGDAQAFELNESSTIEEMIHQEEEDEETNPTEYYFTLYTFVFCFALPTVVITFFSFKVLTRLMQASRRARERLRNRQKQYAYKKVTRLVLLLVVFFVVCWSPVWIMSLIVLLNPFYIQYWYFRIAFNAVHALPYLNCAINPVVYALLTEPFKRILQEKFVSLRYSLNSVFQWPSMSRNQQTFTITSNPLKMVSEKRSSSNAPCPALCRQSCLTTKPTVSATNNRRHYQNGDTKANSLPLMLRKKHSTIADSCCGEDSIDMKSD